MQLPVPSPSEKGWGEALNPKQIAINDYTYHLPNDKIALHPLLNRDESKLLIYKDGVITEDTYKSIHQHLPKNSLLIFNNTKVINARLQFVKDTGGVIEIFLLEPFNADYTSTLASTKKCSWKCLIGGVSKWKQSSLQLTVNGLQLNAILLEKLTNAYVVEFNWNNEVSFAEVLEQVGNIPLPPYIKRKPEEEDANRYQTVYAQHNGSVAAPTAGLHFTPYIFEKLSSCQIKKDFVTLHVGAGTFKPVKAASMQQHEMHTEWIDVSIETIENIIENLNQTIVAVGTTSLRTIESLYWLGVKAFLNPSIKKLELFQWDVYEDELKNTNFTPTQALIALLGWMQKNKLSTLFTSTQILIAPGYKFKIAKAIFTNFHQPQSTLLLLVAAAIGEDWKKVYDYALQNQFRFLSYGDGSLLFIKN
ncbi:MAG: S-adenosylmethionine:tRNA ribosyltransferase-isomerase [Ferruginibacter sp.]|nr:S-adenosylmethionine:tRNA ribosyltransferase-isomerase [Ferruginibacter sp.]